jgi:SulP family sulfate permease
VVALVCAVLTLATLLFVTGLFTYLPEATLGAVVIMALHKYFSLAGLRRLYRVRRADFALSASALAGVLLFGVLPGVVIGVVLSLTLLILRESNANSAVLGRRPGGDEFADVVTHPDYEVVPGLLVYRFDGPLVFPTVDRFAAEVRALVGAAPEKQPVRAVVLDLEATADMDTTAADQFTALVTSLRAPGVQLMLARLHAPVRDFMEKDGLMALIGAGEIYPRVLDAVRRFEQAGSGRTRPEPAVPGAS